MDNTNLRILGREMTVPMGQAPRVVAVNKFGENLDVGLTAEDIVSGGGVWVPPTAARVHQIKSTSANDTAAGTGLQTVRVYGLTSWDTLETSQDITMDGTDDVATSAYVIIHRLQALTWGSAGPNVGAITATADTDSTVTARIEIGKGQTQMAVYGFSSLQTLLVSQYYTEFLAGSAAATDVSVDILFNSIPDVQTLGYISKHDSSLNSDSPVPPPHRFDPFYKFEGPGIIKIQAVADKANALVMAGFDGYLVTN